MNNQSQKKIKDLIGKGVKIPNPATVDIGAEVNPDRISGEGVTVYSGCKIYGESTLIMSGVKLGLEEPVTIQNCQLGPGVELKGGFFRKSVFLRGARMGSGAQVRDACIMEEETNGANTVGLKHTILFPFVTLGSLINFCDCLMAGGTSRQNHSEVGSSYIHFNYTPNQDKATPSLIGDVPRGVMLNQAPIFLGGQGGLIGPSRIGYGTVITAGSVYRGDCPEGGKLLSGENLKKEELNFYPGVYWKIRERTVNNINYIANLVSFRQWYRQVRSLFFAGDSMNTELHRGALEKLDMAIDERISRLQALAEKMPYSAKTYEKIMKEKASRKLLTRKRELSSKWPEIEDLLQHSRAKKGNDSEREQFLERVQRGKEEKGDNYIAVIQGLETKWSLKGIAWLQGIVDEINNEILEIIPSFKS